MTFSNVTISVSYTTANRRIALYRIIYYYYNFRSRNNTVGCGSSSSVVTATAAATIEYYTHALYIRTCGFRFQMSEIFRDPTKRDSELGHGVLRSEYYYNNNMFNIFIYDVSTEISHYNILLCISYIGIYEKIENKYQRNIRLAEKKNRF